MENELENRRHYNASDMSVTKVTKDVLFMVRSYSTVLGGNQWGTYIFLLIIIGLLNSLLETSIRMHGFIFFTKIENFKEYFNMMILPILGLTIALFFWRRELPICFNKKTGMVSVWLKGRLFQLKRDNLRLYRDEQRAGRGGGLEATSFFVKEDESKKMHRVLIADHILWLEKLINDFLDGKDITFDEYTLNKIKRGNFELSIKKLFVLRFIDSYYAFSKWEKILLYPFYFLYSLLIGFPTDLLMYGLNKILPRREIPKELREACGISKDERVYG